MEREGRIRSAVLTILTLYALISCSSPVHETIRKKDVRIRFTSTDIEVKAYDPDEDLISDLSVFIFDESGELEGDFRSEGGEDSFDTSLLIGKEYTICACANFGYRIYADNLERLEEVRYHMAYPDDYRNGMPMSAREEIVLGEDDDEISLSLRRLMAKISIQIDRGHLSEDVSMYVRSVRIGNCPRSAAVFTENKTRDEDDCFPVGFIRKDEEVYGLNSSLDGGLSREISLYMLENMQGELDSPISSDNEKVFDEDDHRRETCSYIEMDIEYISDRYYSTRKGLLYRFYLGEDRNNLDVERNCHYHITVTPEDDGLSDDGWRVDKSGLNEYGPISFKAYPSEYIVGDIGDKIHIWCDVSPRSTPFDVGISYMEDDKAEGIYDYEIDEDGFGATLTLTGPGRGLIYMEAGEPVNEAALFVIEVNLP